MKEKRIFIFLAPVMMRYIIIKQNLFWCRGLKSKSNIKYHRVDSYAARCDGVRCATARQSTDMVEIEIEMEMEIE
jgi:hypothetical protein